MAAIIRRFDPGDQQQAADVVLAGLGEHFGFIDRSLNPDLTDIQTSFMTAGHDFYVAESGGRIVGTVGLLFEGPHTRIVRMSVAKDYRGEGIGKALLQQCIKRTKEHGVSEIVAFTEPHWSDAVGFYAAFGFEQYGKDEIDIHLRLVL